ncbi:MAG TPA: DUF2844 domain-containing protein [Steroidobacteraceae bacterium]|nr:DUF2844 domain-containing protein [Steroidobacteraceae bacterium]
MSMRLNGWRAAAGVAILTLTSLPALAGLGGDVSSVSVDRANMRAQLRGTTPGKAFSVEQLELPSGTVVSEYISPDGKVFAVSWRGPTKPDLRQTLGSYFDQVVAASKQAPHSPATRRHFQIRQSDLVFESNGRMRDFYGRAYIPSLLPPNVSSADIQ